MMAMTCKAVAVERISVKSDRISLLVRVAPGKRRYAWPHLAEQTLHAFPDLAFHSCVNDAGTRLADVLHKTSIPHILEHLIIDLQIHDPRVPADAALAGSTEWIREEEGLARVEVNYTDDLVALEALQKALAFLNERMAD